MVYYSQEAQNIMYLQKSYNKKTGRTHLSIVHKYRDKDDPKKIRSKTVKSIGYADQFEDIYENPIAHFTQVAKEMDAERLKDAADYVLTIPKNEKLASGTDTLQNFGYAALSKIYHELDIDLFINNHQRDNNAEYNANTIMKMLVYSRILYPGSKKNSYENRNRFFENTDYSLDDVYRCLTFLDKEKEELKKWLNDRVKRKYGRDTSLVYYDVTNYYFESDDFDGFKMKGVSKEHRPNPIVQMGLFMDNKGLPVTYKLFPGNTNDCLTFRPNLKQIKADFGLGRVITVADKAMCTGDNIWYTLTTPSHDGYVFSMSVRGATEEIKEYVLDQKGYISKGEDFKFKSRLEPREIQVSMSSGKKVKKTVDEKQVVFYSEKYARRAREARRRAVEKANDLIAHPGKYKSSNSHGASKYVEKLAYDKKTGEILENDSLLNLNEDLIKEEEKYDGYYLLVTSEMDKTDGEIIDMYRGLWKIEESFKLTKSELEARPVYLSTEEHIQAHFLTCFVSLLILRIIEMKLERRHDPVKIVESLRSCTCALAAQNIYLFHYFDDVLKDIGQLMDIDFSTKALSLKEIKKILGSTKK